MSAGPCGAVTVPSQVPPMGSGAATGAWAQAKGKNQPAHGPEMGEGRHGETVGKISRTHEDNSTGGHFTKPGAHPVAVSLHPVTIAIDRTFCDVSY